jgi:hypothetical protein
MCRRLCGQTKCVTWDEARNSSKIRRTHCFPNGNLLTVTTGNSSTSLLKDFTCRSIYSLHYQEVIEAMRIIDVVAMTDPLEMQGRPVSATIQQPTYKRSYWY